MIAFHVLGHTLDKSLQGSLEDLPWFILLFGFLFLILNSFRSFFLMISATVNTASMQYNLLSGQKPSFVWKKQLVSGSITYIAGLITESIFGHNAFIPISIEHKKLSPLYLTRILHCETLMIIGLCMILVSTIHHLLSLNNGYLKFKRNLVIYAVLGVITLTATPFIKGAYTLPYIGADPSEGYYTITSVGEFFKNLALSPIFGFPQPLFPFFATACIGNCLAILLTNADKFRNPKWIVSYSKIFAALMILAGIIIVVTRLEEVYLMLEQKFFVHPIWFWLITNGFQLIIIVWFLGMNEFNSKKTEEGYKKHTLLLRRWGMVSMSLFVWQAYPELLLRFIGTWITPFDFVSRHSTPAVPVVILMVITVAVWDVLIRLWEKVKFKGSLEWLMQIVKKRKYELEIEGILYDVESIRFVPPITPKEMIDAKI
jgi:hypothetical protein